MSNRSFTDRIRDPEERAETLNQVQDYGRHNQRPLILGALFGIMLGLFIGWVVWPIQWTNAWPADLADEPQADYIAAVADAFVASRSDDAAALAYRRLSSFGDEMETALADAEHYFVEHPTIDSGLRITNIQELAASVRPVTVPDVTVEDAEAMVEPAAEEAAEDQVTPVPTSESSEWIKRALWLLAAFVLIVGGIWVLRAVRVPQEVQPSPIDDDEIDEFDDADLDGHLYDGSDEVDEDKEPSVADDAWIDDTQIDDAGAAVATTAAAIAGAMAINRADTERPSTGEADAEEPQSSADTVTSYAPPSSPVEDSPSISVRAGTAGAAPDSTYLDDQDGYGFGPETNLPTGSGSTTVVVDTDPEPKDVEVESATPAPESDEATTEAGNEIPRGTAHAALLPSGREISRYTATYYPMLDEYEEAFRIEDGSANAYIGDCGMGVNMAFGFVQHNPEQVAALDVWLIDLVEEDAMSFHPITLVSKYGAAHLPNDKTDDASTESAAGPESEPSIIEPTAGDQFQIVGKHLLIDCEVTKATYMESGTAAGVFQGLEVNLIVSHRL